MARIDYDQRTAAAYQAVREAPRPELVRWRDALRRHLDPSPERRVVDIGAGTGAFATALRDWFGVQVVAVEPSAAMRARIPRDADVRIVGAQASALGLRAACADAAWLSTVIHHIPDLASAAAGIRRVLRPGAPVLIRTVLPGHTSRLTLGRFFPGIARVLDTYPSAERLAELFGAVGFASVTNEAMAQRPDASLAEFAQRLDRLRAADTLVRSLTEAEYADGRRRVARALADDRADQVDLTSTLDLVVLR